MNRMLIGLFLFLGCPRAAEWPLVSEPYFLFNPTFQRVSELDEDYIGSSIGIRFKNDTLVNQGGGLEVKLPIRHRQNWNHRDMELDGIRMIGKSGQLKWHFLFEVLGSDGDSIYLAPYFSRSAHLKVGRDEVLGFTSTGTRKNRWLTFSIWMAAALVAAASVRVVR